MNTADDWSIGILAFFGAVVTVRLVEWLSRRRGLLDRPVWRSAHVMATPRLGGIGIVAAVWAGVLLAPRSAATDDLTLLLLCATALAAVGLIDDLRPLPAAVRLGAQVLAATGFVVTVSPSIVIELPGLSVNLMGAIAVAVGVLWIVAVVNAWNFIDGIDGLAAAMTVVAAIGIASVGGVAALPAALGAACLGFLAWNRPRASIFMGDGGSLFLGFLVGGAWFIEDTPAPLVPAVLILAPVLLDTGYTLARRLMSGKDVMQAHHDHLYQVLARSGVTPWLIDPAYVAAGIACIAAARAYPGAETTTQTVIIGAVLVVFAIFAFIVGRLPALSRRRAQR